MSILRACVLGGLLGVGGCSSGTAGCAANSDCAAGQVCADGACALLCIADVDCPTAQICDSGLCVEGTRSVPLIIGVDGDSTNLCNGAAPGTHCLAAGLVVTGDRLEGASFSLAAADAAAFELTARPGGTNQRVELDLPDVAPGDYTLTAVNSAGSAEQALQLLRGERGTDGVAFSPSADELVLLINGSSLQLVRDRLPVGEVAGTVAAGEHTHPELGALADDIGEVATDVAGLTANGVTLAGDIAAGRVPAGAVLSFDLAACPTGWSEYAPAYGRFVRGIDRPGTTDPDGTRAPGTLQGDMLASHTHSYVRIDNIGIDGVDSTVRDASDRADTGATSGAAGGAETRGKNVALLYCRKD